MGSKEEEEEKEGDGKNDEEEEDEEEILWSPKGIWCKKRVTWLLLVLLLLSGDTRMIEGEMYPFANTVQEVGLNTMHSTKSWKAWTSRTCIGMPEGEEEDNDAADEEEVNESTFIAGPSAEVRFMVRLPQV
jgi:hypothetical protein